MINFIKNNLAFIYGVFLGSLVMTAIFLFNDFFSGSLKEDLALIQSKYDKAVSDNNKLQADMDLLQGNYEKTLKELNNYHEENNRLTKNYKSIIDKKEKLIQEIKSTKGNPSNVNKALGATEEQAIQISLANFNALRETYELYRNKKGVENGSK